MLISAFGIPNLKHHILAFLLRIGAPLLGAVGETSHTEERIANTAVSREKHCFYVFRQKSHGGLALQLTSSRYK